jgi:hypothetical protein
MKTLGLNAIGWQGIEVSFDVRCFRDEDYDLTCLLKKNYVKSIRFQRIAQYSFFSSSHSAYKMY